MNCGFVLELVFPSKYLWYSTVINGRSKKPKATTITENKNISGIPSGILIYSPKCVYFPKHVSLSFYPLNSF